MTPPIESTNSENPRLPEKRKTSFTGDMLRLVSGSTVSQIIVIALSPIIARLFLPDAFGNYAVYNSIIAILTVIVCLRYELAIALPKEDGEASSIFALCLVITLAITAAVTCLVIFVGDEFVQLIRAGALQPFLWTIPVGTLTAGVILSFSYWNIRNRRFSRQSIYMVVNNGVTSFAQLGIGVWRWMTSGGVTIGSVIGTVTATLYLVVATLRKDFHILRQGFTFSGMRAGAVRYQKFPRLTTWSSLLNTLSWQLPTLMLNYFFSSTVSGFYAVGMRVLQVPINVIGQSIGQVYFAMASEAKQNGTLPQAVRKTLERLVSYSLFPILCLMFTGQYIFAIVLGAEWQTAGVYVQILCPWMFFWFISSPMAQTFNIVERQEFDLRLNVITFLTRLAALLIGGMTKNAFITIALFSFAGVLAYGFSAYSITRLAGLKAMELIKIFTRHLAWYIAAGTILSVVTLTGLAASPWIPTIVTAVLIGGYYFALFRKDPELLALIKKK